MSHATTTPAAVRDGILQGLSVLRLQGGQGVLRTLAPFAGARDDEDDVDRHLHGGLPAVLVAYAGGPMTARAMHQQLFAHAMRFELICVSGAMTSTAEGRLAGSAGDPGIERLLDWVSYYAVRAAAALTGVSKVYPVAHEILTWQPGRYVASVPLTCERAVDVYDEELAATLEAAGLVHSPLDYDDLWSDAADTDPNSEYLDGVDGGVADL